MKAIPARGNSSVGEGKRAKSAASWRYAASSYSRQPFVYVLNGEYSK